MNRAEIDFWNELAEKDEDARIARQSRNLLRCQCGYPDMPGTCPGPANCPMCEPEDEDAEIAKCCSASVIEAHLAKVGEELNACCDDLEQSDEPQGEE